MSSFLILNTLSSYSCVSVAEQVVYLHETYCFFFVYVYGVIYTGDIYGVNYAGNNVNQIEKNPGLSIILHSFSQVPIFTRGLET